MSESWFEHRAVNVNAWGNRDLGLAQAADITRTRMVRLYRAGEVDTLFEEQDYFDPLKATRFAVIWMELLLRETGGDLDTAVRAYHRGTRRALRGEGMGYLAMTKRRHLLLTRRDAGSPSLDCLCSLDGTLARASPPWRRALLEEARHTTPGRGASVEEGPVRAHTDRAPASMVESAGERR